MHYNRRGRRAGSSTSFAARGKIDRQQRSDENAPVTVAWAIGALIIFAASLVMGLAGFGIALVAMAFLPWVMSPVTAVVLLTIYALVFSIVMVIPLVREIVPRALVDLLVGSAVGTPLGVCILATLPVTALNRLIGAFLLLVCLLEFRRALPTQATGRGWGLSAGFLSGVIGAALGTPGPPVIVYASAQNWSPRAFKANVTGFFVVNQAVILVGYWWAGLMTPDVWQATAVFAAPALVGVAVGVALFGKLDPARFRRVVFALLSFSALVLLVKG